MSWLSFGKSYFQNKSLVEKLFLFAKFERGSRQASLDGNLRMVLSGFGKCSPLFFNKFK